MIHAILFDLDNTLVDFMKMKKNATQAALSSMIDAGLKIEEEKGMKRLFGMYEKFGFENQEIFDRFIKEVHGELNYKILAAGVFAYRRVKSGYLEPYPHATSTLIKLKEQGLKIGIVSDAPKKQAWLRLVELRLAEFFDLVIALEDTGKLKPNKMPFQKAIERLGVEPNEILFVGDNPERDIKGAKSVGMKTALAKYGQVAIKGRQTKADFELKDLNDLLKIIALENKKFVC